MIIWDKNFSLLFIIVKLYQVICQTGSGDPCNTNLECLLTGCCHNNMCSPPSKCTKINRVSYALIGCSGIVFVGLSFLYFYLKVRKIRKSILDIKKMDDKFYLNRRNSNADMFRRSRELQENENKNF